jgi:DNA-binding NarL/FixJ family response regulator
MFRRKRRTQEAEPRVGEDAFTASTQAAQAPPPVDRAILVGPRRETRDRLATLIAAWTEIRVLGTYPSFDEASATLRDDARREGTAVLLDARLPPRHEPRSVIRSIRERFPASRIIVFGDDLDEVAIEHHYFAGADAVILADAKEDDVVAAIRDGVPGRDDAGGREIRDGEVEAAQEAPSSEADSAEQGAAGAEPVEDRRRPRGRRLGGRIRRRVRLGKDEAGDELRQSIARSLERTVTSLQPTEPKAGDPEAG